MSSDDVLYLTLLLSSTGLGFYVRNVKNAANKQLLCTTLGFVMISLLSGHHICHLVILTTLNALIVLNISKRYCHVYSFVFCFLYLIFVRLLEYFGLSSAPEVTNTALMIMVLKMVGLAYEVNMHYLMTLEPSSENRLREEYMRIELTFCDIFQYSFCYAGIFVGPYYKFRTYQDMFNKPYSNSVQHVKFLKRRILVIPLYIILYLATEYFFPLSMVSSPELLDYSFLYRFFCMTPWFFSFRMRIYIAFVLGECICINLGLGAYPVKSLPQSGEGPTDFLYLREIENKIASLPTVSYSFETIRCMNEMASEFKPTVREGVRYWNMTVQYWLAIYIYQKTDASKPVKMVVTMFVSALWHGVRAGYYLSLLGTPLLLLCEIEVRRAFRRNYSEIWKKRFDFISYFIKMQCLAYIAAAFIIVDTADILNYWRSIRYIGHMFILVMFALSFFKLKFSKVADIKVENQNDIHIKKH